MIVGGPAPGVRTIPNRAGSPGCGVTLKILPSMVCGRPGGGPTFAFVTTAPTCVFAGQALLLSWVMVQTGVASGLPT
jgi:hypothetical protein